MMRNKLLRVIALIGVLIPFLFGYVALAITDPDSTPSITSTRVNRNLLETGDVLIYGEHNIPYTSIPDEPASATYIFRLLATDGETEIGAVSPFVLVDGGYNEGCFAFYFSASDNLVWGQPYVIRISQSPAYFDTPESYDYVISISHYTSSTEQETNQLELAINIISIADNLEGYHSDYDFLEPSAGGTVLSSPTGETYFRGVIYGVQSMAPSLFLVQVITDNVTTLDFTTDEFDSYVARWEGTWVDTDTEATATQFGVTVAMVMGLLFALPLCIGAIIVSSMKFGTADAGFVFSALALIMVAVMGWIPAAIFAALYQAMGIYLAYVWFYSRG